MSLIDQENSIPENIIPENSTIVLGDIHGKLEIVEYALELSNKYNVVFLGDFLDSFDRTIDEQFSCLCLVLDAIQNNPNVTALVGNHELSYIYNDRHLCSGFNLALNARLNAKLMGSMGSIVKDAEKHLLRCTVVNDWLITHAGVSKSWLYPLNTPELNYSVYEIAEHINNLSLEEFAHVGNARGGYGIGGPVWCDWSEFIPINNIKQVFGHSSYSGSNGIRNIGDNYLIDVLDYKNEFLILLPDGGVRIHTFTIEDQQT